MPHRSMAVANEFLERAFLAERPITAMHLQRFCYLAHGFTLALLDHALTSDKPEAWDYGPVYPELYRALLQFGIAPVSRLIFERGDDPMRDNVVRAALSDSESQLIDAVWQDYGQFQAFQLSALTHKADSPWAKIYKPGLVHLRIPDIAIKQYFLDLTQSDNDADSASAYA